MKCIEIKRPQPPKRLIIRSEEQIVRALPPPRVINPIHVKHVIDMNDYDEEIPSTLYCFLEECQVAIIKTHDGQRLHCLKISCPHAHSFGCMELDSPSTLLVRELPNP